ncbi:MAG: LEPR-XLL domain-containing protein [Verrucomicrobiia bacterium]
MIPKPRRSEFALEPLEPRLLLSSDGLSGLNPLPPDDPFLCDYQVLQEREHIQSALFESPEEERAGLFAGLNDSMADLDAEDQGTSAAADDSRAEPESTVTPAARAEQASAPESSSVSGCNIDDVGPLFATVNGLDAPSVNQTVHQLTASLLVANGPPDTRVHLQSLPGGLNWSDVSSGIRDTLDALGGVTGILNGLGDFADNLPLLGRNLGQLLDSASIIRDRISEGLVRSLFDGLPALVTDAVGVVTSRIRAWSGTSTDGVRITAVEAENNPGPTRDHFWWDIRLTLALTGADRALEDVAGAVFGAVFTGTPEVNVETSLVLDFSFGYDGGFFVDLDALEARAEVHVDNLGELEFGVSFGSIGSLEVSAGNLDLVASVTVEPDAGVLDAADRITMAGLTDATSVSDAFNLETDGSLRASLTLDGTLTFLGFELTGSATVGIRSDDLFNGQAPEFTLSVAG